MESPEAAEGIKTRKKYRGVYQLISGNWTAFMYDPNKKKVFTLGTFKTAEDATMSHDKAALRFRGCRAKLNFPERIPARNEAPGSEKQLDPSFQQLPMDHQRLQECSGGQEKNPGRDCGFLGKRPMIGSCQFPPAKVDMEAQIHHLEQQAYTCVVRAFKSQSDAITGAKESLITELRKEVGVSDEEHQDLLSKVNGEELINVIREWRADGGLQEAHPTVLSSRVNHYIPPSSGQFPPVQNGMDTLIHLIEQEAYTSVLRAFEARSDAITWEEKSVITELRKELRISEEEHQELLSEVIAEEIINDIRERRNTCGHQPGISRPVQDREPHPTVSDLHKKRKISQAAMSLDVLSSMCCLPSPSRASMKGQKTTSPEDVREDDQDQGILSGVECSGAGRGSQESVPHARKAGKYHIPASFNHIAESPVSQQTSMHHILQADSGPVRRSETRALQDGRSVHHEHTDEDHQPSISREPHPTVSASCEARMSVKVPSSTLGQLFQPSAIRPSTKQEKTTPSEDVRENDQDQGIVCGGKLRISLKGCTSIVEAPVPKQPKVGKILQTGSRQVSWPQTAALHDEGSRLRDGSKVMVMVSYKNRFVIRFELSLSSTKLEMEKIVAANLNLSVGGFGVAYQDEENDWILIGCDEHLRTCLRTSRSSGNDSIRMMVVCS